MPLTIEEIAGCRESFDGFDKDGGGTIDIMELKNILNGLGAQPTDDELNLMIIQVDEDGSREINFAVFLKIIEKHKSLPGYMDKEEMDSLEAFAALGGGHDGTGSIPIDKVKALVQVGIPAISVVEATFSFTVTVPNRPDGPPRIPPVL
eukprot:1192442-Prorocentrum_minimum.AAC.1